MRAKEGRLVSSSSSWFSFCFSGLMSPLLITLARPVPMSVRTSLSGGWLGQGGERRTGPRAARSVSAEEAWVAGADLDGTGAAAPNGPRRETKNPAARGRVCIGWAAFAGAKWFRSRPALCYRSGVSTLRRRYPERDDPDRSLFWGLWHLFFAVNDRFITFTPSKEENSTSSAPCSS